MIISHRHRFIFIKTRKTAGSSVEMALSTFCGPADIITPLLETEDRIRRQMGGRGPQHYHTPLSSYTRDDWKRLLRYRIRAARFQDHKAAAYIRQFVEEQVWNSYFKFCIERNPWDKALSYWHFRRSQGYRASLRDFIFSDELRRASDWRLYTDKEAIVVDRIIQYEDLYQGLEEIRKTIGLPAFPKIPHAKSGIRKDPRPYWQVLASDERDRIAEVFEREIAYFGYAYVPAG